MQPSYEEQKEKFSIIKKKPHHVPPHLHNAIAVSYTHLTLPTKLEV